MFKPKCAHTMPCTSRNVDLQQCCHAQGEHSCIHEDGLTSTPSSKDLRTSLLPTSACKGINFSPVMEPKKSLELAGVKGDAGKDWGGKAIATPCQHKPVSFSHSSDSAGTMANQSRAGAWQGFRQPWEGQHGSQDTFRERGGSTGGLLIGAQQGRGVFSAGMCALHVGSRAPGNLLSD